MAETFTFEVPTPAEGEAEIAEIRLYESPDGILSWNLVDSIPIGDLIDNGNGTFSWPSDFSDETAYHKLVTASATPVIESSGVIIPPRPNTDMCTIFANTKDIMGAATSGVRLQAKLSNTGIVVGGSLLTTETHTFTTDDDGFVTFDVVRGAIVDIHFAPIGAWVEIDTTGREVIDLAVEAVS